MPMAMPIKWRLALTAALSLVGLFALAGHSSGQNPQDGGVQKTAATNQPAAPKPVTPAVVGSIDLDAVLKGYEKFKSQTEAMKVDMIARQKDLMKIEEQAKTVGEQSSKFQPGTPDYKRLEGQFAQLKAQLQVATEQAQSEFQQREADMIAGIFNVVQAMTAAVAQRHRMTFVVRVSHDTVSGSEPNSVMSAMRRPVLYSDPGTDITNEVVGYLNQNYRMATGAASAKSASHSTTPAPSTPR
jgi:outer membrane protein